MTAEIQHKRSGLQVPVFLEIPLPQEQNSGWYQGGQLDSLLHLCLFCNSTSFFGVEVGYKKVPWCWGRWHPTPTLSLTQGTIMALSGYLPSKWYNPKDSRWLGIFATSTLRVLFNEYYYLLLVRTLTYDSSIEILNKIVYNTKYKNIFPTMCGISKSLK